MVVLKTAAPSSSAMIGNNRTSTPPQAQPPELKPTKASSQHQQPNATSEPPQSPVSESPSPPTYPQYATACTPAGSTPSKPTSASRFAISSNVASKALASLKATQSPARMKTSAALSSSTTPS